MQACSLQGNNAGQRDAPIRVKHQLTTAFRRHFATFFVFRAKSGVWRRFSGQKAPASRMVGRHASGNRLMTRHFAIPYFPERRQPPGKRKKLPHSDSKRVASAIGAADRTGPSAIGAVGARAGRSGQRSTQTRTRDGKSHEPGRTAKRTTPGRTKKRPFIEWGLSSERRITPFDSLAVERIIPEERAMVSRMSQPNPPACSTRQERSGTRPPHRGKPQQTGRPGQVRPEASPPQER